MEITPMKGMMVIMNLSDIESMERYSIIYDILVPSLHKLYENDHFNIRIGVSERNICARLAHHMEIIMHESNQYNDYFADVEYNRKNDGSEKHYDNNQKVSPKMVADLIVHKRDWHPNLLAVEMKRRNNPKKREKDRERLKNVVYSPRLEDRKEDCVYDTSLGAFIIYSPERILVELYENVNGEGKQTGEMEYACIMDGDQFMSLEKVREIWD